VVASNLLALCPPLPVAADGTLATLLQNHVDVAQAYNACATLHRDLVGAVRGQAGIITDAPSSTTPTDVLNLSGKLLNLHNFYADARL
jgi:hypothetical protein